MIPLFSSFIRRKEMDAVLACMVTDSVGPGEYSDRFIKAAKEVFGYEAAAAFRSPHTAISLILRRFGLERGAKVGISALAPYYHAVAVEDAGLEPWYYDHDPQTMEPILPRAEDMSGVRVLMLYEPFGILPSAKTAAELDMPVIEDTSQALGASRRGMFPGEYGSFAFYALEQGALVTAGGGAILFSKEKKEAQIVRDISENTCPELALTDFNAALGIAQLKDMPSSIRRRSELEERFSIQVARTRHRPLRQQEEGDMGRIAFPVLLESGMRDVIIHAKKNGVEAAPAFEQSVVSGPEFQPSICPGSRSLALRCVLFPLHDRISLADARILEKVLATLP
ncbi:MAG TPA: DegT/DnrJ/EryC1/StrS family aminotransferase [Rectinemataceae bacterium]